MVSLTCFQHHLWNNYKCNNRGKKKSFAPIAIWWGMGKLFHLTINACALYENSTSKFCNSHFFYRMFICIFPKLSFWQCVHGVGRELLVSWCKSGGGQRAKSEDRQKKRSKLCFFSVVFLFKCLCDFHYCVLILDVCVAVSHGGLGIMAWR